MKKWLLMISLFAVSSQPLLAKYPDSIACQENYKKSKKFGLLAVMAASASIGLGYCGWISRNSDVQKVLVPICGILFGSSIACIALSNKYGNMVQH